MMTTTHSLYMVQCKIRIKRSKFEREKNRFSTAKNSNLVCKIMELLFRECVSGGSLWDKTPACLFKLLPPLHYTTLNDTIQTQPWNSPQEFCFSCSTDCWKHKTSGITFWKVTLVFFSKDTFCLGSSKADTLFAGRYLQIDRGSGRHPLHTQVKPLCV